MTRSIIFLTVILAIATIANCIWPEKCFSQEKLPWVTEEVKAPRVARHVFASEAAGTDVSFHLYTPPAYDRDGEVRLPVLYWLHGTAGGLSGVLPLARLMHTAMQSGEIPPMLVVFVNGLPARLWCDSKNGSAPVETVFIRELIPHIDRNFRTIAAREGRILEGFSMGGYGAGRLGFRYPELFAGVSMLAGGPLDLEFAGPRTETSPALRRQVLHNVCSDDMDYFRQQSPWTIAETAAARLGEYKTRIRMVVGDRDFSLDLNKKFHDRLTELQISHEFTVLPNVAHDTRAVLELLGRKNGEFYRSALAGTGDNNPAMDRTPAESQNPAPPETVSFEQFQPGQFEVLETSIGKWAPAAGSTIVDDKHAKTGTRCLQLTGGDETSVILDLADGADTTGEIVFWAERWTSREPFGFRIEKDSGNGWQEIYNGDSEIRVGRAFKSMVRVPLGDGDIQQLRFSVTSPPGTGILIDDVLLAPAVPQTIVSVEVVPMTLPALVGTDASSLQKLKIETAGSLNPISLTRLQASIEGVSGDIRSARVFFGGSDGDFKSLTPFGNRWDPALEMAEFTGQQELKAGTNHFWITGKLRRDANIDRLVGASCKLLTFSNGQTIALDDATSWQRMGVALRKGGDDGVHTFRIPGLATTNRGTLIGVYDARYRGGGDLPGDIDVGMSKSTDGGRTWEPMKIIMDMGDDPQWNYDGIGDPAVLVDRNTGTVWVAATWSHGNRSWNGSGPGMTPEETGQLILIRSDDDGATWSEPINITSQVKDPKWSFILQGPGKGITMRDGTLVFAAQYQDPPEQRRLPHSTIIFSTDHGETWQVGTAAQDDTTESQVVEIEPGVLMLNCRYNRDSTRVVMTTRDMGQTWQKHPTSERSLIEPRACMASLIDVDQETGDGAGGWLLFSNPDSTTGRNHITIKASPDRGLTWPKQHRLLLDEENSAGYSCMTMIDNETVGILYEGSQSQLTFQRIPLKELVNDVADPKETKTPPKATQPELPRVFGNHMVLQANQGIPVWGQATPGATIHVTLDDSLQSAIASPTGYWQVDFPPREPSAEPVKMVVRSEDGQIELSDILIGEVWICAGQSNMAWPLAKSDGGEEELGRLRSINDKPKGTVQRGLEETSPVGSSLNISSQDTSRKSTIRLLHLTPGADGNPGNYTVQQLARLHPENCFDGRWQVATAESAGDFSAVGWYFGRYLQQELDVPVGLICLAVGGTPTEAWIPRETLEDRRLKELVTGNWLDNESIGEFCRTRGEQNLLQAIQAGETVPGDDLGPNHPFKPGFMWDAGIEPLHPFSFRGLIWYQGESNAETLSQVRQQGLLFQLLIGQLRWKWGGQQFPVIFVQLPAMNRPHWPLFREAQRRAQITLWNVGMVVTIDTGEAENVHPPLKKPVGERLAKWALFSVYKLWSYEQRLSPLPLNFLRDGASILVSFRNANDGLKSSDEKPLRHFEVCGEDGVFHQANARIIDSNTVEVSSPEVPLPLNVRYAWIPFPDPPVNLFNSDGLPASPFSSEKDETLFPAPEPKKVK